MDAVEIDESGKEWHRWEVKAAHGDQSSFSQGDADSCCVWSDEWSSKRTDGKSIGPFQIGLYPAGDLDADGHSCSVACRGPLGFITYFEHQVKPAKFHVTKK